MRIYIQVIIYENLSFFQSHFLSSLLTLSLSIPNHAYTHAYISNRPFFNFSSSNISYFFELDKKSTTKKFRHLKKKFNKKLYN